MFALVLLTYEVPLAEIERHIDEHRAYLRTLHGRGKLVASGPLVPRTGGALLLAGDDRAEVDALVAGDPFFQRGLARYEVREWAPVIGADALERGRVQGAG